MKYIKPYKIFESMLLKMAVDIDEVDEIVNYVKDIALEINDIGLYIKKIQNKTYYRTVHNKMFCALDKHTAERWKANYYEVDPICFEIGGDYEQKRWMFNINEVDDTIRSIIGYMQSIGYEYFQVYKAPNTRIHKNITDKFIGNKKFLPKNKEELMFIYMVFSKTEI